MTVKEIQIAEYFLRKFLKFQQNFYVKNKNSKDWKTLQKFGLKVHKSKLDENLRSKILNLLKIILFEDISDFFIKELLEQILYTFEKYIHCL